MRKQKHLLLFEKGQVLSAPIIKELRENGYLPVEVADVTKVRLLAANDLGLTPGMLTMAAIEAISGSASTDERSKFALNLLARLKKEEGK